MVVVMAIRARWSRSAAMKGVCRYGNVRNGGGSAVRSYPERTISGYAPLREILHDGQGVTVLETKIHQCQIDRYGCSQYPNVDPFGDRPLGSPARGFNDVGQMLSDEEIVCRYGHP